MAKEPTFILASGELFPSQNAEDTHKLRKLGMVEASAEAIRHDNLKQQYSGWQYAATAGALGVVNTALPGATGLVSSGLSAIDPQLGQDFNDIKEGTEAAHPWAKGAGMVAGMLAPGGLAGKAAGALTKAGAGAVATAATVGAGTTMAMTYDQRATDHIQTPEGAEKVAAIYAGAGLLGALTGGLVSYAGGKLAAGAIGKTGAEMEEYGASKIAAKTPINNPGVVARMEEKGTTDEVQAFMSRHEIGIETSLKQTKIKAREIAKEASKTIREEARLLKTEESAQSLSLQEHTRFSQTLRKQLAGTDAQEVIFGKSALAPEGLEDLHAMREMLHEQAGVLGLGSKYSPALNTVDKYMSALSEKAAGAGGHDAERFAAAQADYQGARALTDALRKTEATGKSWVGTAGRLLSSYGKGHAVFNVFGGNPVGVGAGLGMIAGGKAITGLAEGNAVPNVVLGLGKAMQTFDDTVVRTTVGLLEGRVVAGQAAPYMAQALGLPDYHTVSAMVQHACDNPTYTVPEMAQRMEESGVPGQCVDAAVGQNIRTLQYLNSCRPQNPWAGQTVAPTPWQPDTGQKARFMEQVNACLDPIGALASLTPLKCETLRAVFPEMINRLSTIAVQEAATRPDMPRKARQKAAMLTGLPADPLDTPQARASLLLNSMSTGQPVQGQARPSGGGGNTISAGQTRLNRMSQQ